MPDAATNVELSIASIHFSQNDGEGCKLLGEPIRILEISDPGHPLEDARQLFKKYRCK
jgi:hypothetical protein